MKHKDQIARLRKYPACSEAINYACEYTSSKKAWLDCNRGDWMLWLLGVLSGKPGTDSRKKLVLCACECARLSLRYVREGEKRPLAAIQTAENWANGVAGVTLQDVRNAARDAAVAASGFCDDAAACAAALAYTDDSASTVAVGDAAAVAVAAAAAGAATGVAAKQKILTKCAKIARKYYPYPPE
jgi:hypothetical protein